MRIRSMQVSNAITRIVPLVNEQWMTLGELQYNGFARYLKRPARNATFCQRRSNV